MRAAIYARIAAEVRWDGKPGERSVWVIAPSGRGRPQELYRVVLQGTGPLRQFTPCAPTNGHKLPVVKYPLEFLWFHEERGDLWDRYLAQALDLSQGIGVVAGSNCGAGHAGQWLGLGPRVLP